MDDHVLSVELVVLLQTGVGKRQKLTGRFKGLVRVLTNPDAPPLIPLEKLTNPQHVVVRAYILRALA